MPKEFVVREPSLKMRMKGKRLAACRIWHDPLAQRWFATVYLPRERHYFQTAARAPGSWRSTDDGNVSTLTLGPNTWEPREPAMERSTEFIPVIPFYNADEVHLKTAGFAKQAAYEADVMELILA